MEQWFLYDSLRFLSEGYELWVWFKFASLELGRVGIFQYWSFGIWFWIGYVRMKESFHLCFWIEKKKNKKQRRYCVVGEFLVFMSFGGVGRRCVFVIKSPRSLESKYLFWSCEYNFFIGKGRNIIANTIIHSSTKKGGKKNQNQSKTKEPQMRKTTKSNQHTDQKKKKNNRTKILIRFKIEIPTLKEKLLSSLVGIHGTFLEHCIDVFLIVIVRDLLDVLDRPPHTARNWSPKPRTAHLRKLINKIDEIAINAKTTNWKAIVMFLILQFTKKELYHLIPPTPWSQKIIIKKHRRVLSWIHWFIFTFYKPFWGMDRG